MIEAENKNSELLSMATVVSDHSGAFLSDVQQTLINTQLHFYLKVL